MFDHAFTLLTLKFKKKFWEEETITRPVSNAEWCSCSIRSSGVWSLWNTLSRAVIIQYSILHEFPFSQTIFFINFRFAVFQLKGMFHQLLWQNSENIRCVIKFHGFICATLLMTNFDWRFYWDADSKFKQKYTD